MEKFAVIITKNLSTRDRNQQKERQWKEGSLKKNVVEEESRQIFRRSITIKKKMQR